MKKKSIIKCLSALLVSSATLTSCMSDIDLSNISKDVKIDESLVVPIGEASYTIEDLIKKFDTKGTFTINPDSADVFFDQVANSEFKFREIDLLKYSQELDKSFFPSPDFTVVIPANTSFPALVSTDSLKLGLNSDPATQRLDSVKISSGTLGIQVDKTALVGVSPDNFKLTLELFPNDAKYKKTISFVPAAFGQVGTVDISNYVMNTSKGASGIPIKFTLSVKTGASSVTVGPTSSIGIKLNFNNLDFDVAYGYFQPSVLATQTLGIPIDISEYFPGGDNLRFANPRAIITAESNIGAYLSFYVNYVKAFNKANPSKEVYAYFGSNPSNHSKTEEFGDKPASPHSWITKTFPRFDNINGHTDQLFDKSVVENPDTLVYEFTVKNASTPNGKPQTPDFITSDGKIKVKIETMIPLHVKDSSNYLWNDTIRDVSKGINDALKDGSIDKAFLILTVTNGLPMKCKYTMTFLDDNRNVIDIPDSVYVIKSPNVYPKGYVNLDTNEHLEGQVIPKSITSQRIQIEVSKSQFDDLKRTKNIAFKLYVDGQDAATPIHITKLNTFGVKLGIFVKGNKTTTIK